MAAEEGKIDCVAKTNDCLFGTADNGESSAVFVFAQVKFNCEYQLNEDQYIPVTLRGSSLGDYSSSSKLDAATMMIRIEQAILQRSNINVKFTFGLPLTSCTPNYQNQGLEVLICGDMRNSGTSSPTPDWTKPDTRAWCHSSLESESTKINRPWAVAPSQSMASFAAAKNADGPVIADFADWTIATLNQYFGLCTQNALACVSSLSDIRTADQTDANGYIRRKSCGDGIVQLNEQCEIHSLIARGYFTGNVDDNVTRFCNASTCSRPAWEYNAVRVHLNWGSSSGVHQDYLSDCRSQACGKHYMTTTSTSVNTVGCFFVCFELPSSLGPELSWISTGSPIPLPSPTAPLYAPYNWQYCYDEQSGCSGTSPPQWKCRSTKTGVWGDCIPNRDGTIYTVKSPAFESYLVSALGSEQLIEKTNDNFTCGPQYVRRYVACLRDQHVLADRSCQQTQIKPDSIVAIEPIPCTNFYSADLYGLPTNTPTQQALPVTAFKLIRSYTTMIVPIRPQIVCSLTTSQRTPNEPCFSSCDSYHHRIVRCMTLQRATYSQNGGVTINFTPSFEDNQSLINSYCQGQPSQILSFPEKDLGSTCDHKYLCESPLNPGTVGKCKDINTCSCSTLDTTIKDPKCFSFPPTSYLPGDLSISRIPIPNSETRCGSATTPYNPTVDDYPPNTNPFNVDCIEWKKKNQCYQVLINYTQPSSDPAAPASFGPATPDDPGFKSSAFDPYCDPTAMKFRTPPFSTLCRNRIDPSEGQSQSNPIDLTNRCTSSQVADALHCTLSNEELRCKITPVTGTDQATLDAAGYDPQSVPYTVDQCRPAFAQFKTFLRKYDDFCGNIQWEVKLTNIQCYVRKGGVLTLSNLDECSDFTPQPAVVEYRNKCQLHCYDNALTFGSAGNNQVPIDTHLGQCDSTTAIQFSQLICGSTFSDDVCTFQSKSVGMKCFASRGTSLAQVPLDYCSYILPPIILTQPCFKFSPLIGIDSPASLSDLMLLEQESRSMPTCRFRPLCSYSYIDKSEPISTTINSSTTVLAADRSTNACAIDFDCQQHGVCGSVRRNTYCGFFSNNKLISWGRQSQSTSSNVQSTLNEAFFNQGYQVVDENQSLYTTSNDNEIENEIFGNNQVLNQHHSSYYTLDLNQHIEMIDDDEVSRRAEQYGIEHPMTVAYNKSNDDHRMQTQQTGSRNSFENLMAQFLINVGNDGTCGAVRSISSCDATQPSNCFAARCYVPTDLSETKAQIDLLDHDQFTTAACDQASVQRHCLVNVTDQLCSTFAIDVHYRCFDIIQGTLADNATSCGLEFGPVTNTFPRTCTVVRGCDRVGDDCFWTSNNGGTRELVHPVPRGDNPPTFDCPKIDELRSDPIATQEYCDGLNFCGSAHTASDCIFYRDANEAEGITATSFPMTASLCSQYQSINPGDLENTFHNYALAENTLTCSNYNACSTWACSQPGTEASVAKVGTDINDMNNKPISGNSAVRAFFNQDTGVITGNNCSSQLSPTASSQTECGVISTYRQVGCLSMKTSSQFAQPTYYFDPNATTCGSMDSQNRELLPLKMHVLRSDVGCPRTLECGPGSVAYGTAACDYIHCPASYLPDASTTSSFPYDHNLKCKGPATDPSQPQPLLPLSQCSSSNTSTDLNPVSVSGKSIPPHTTCLFIQPFCKKNLQIPMGFGPNANMTDTSGKYFPEDHAEYTKPLSLRLMLDAGCSQSSATFQQAFMTNDQNQIANTNRNMAQGESFTLGLSYTYHSLSLSMAVYLVPISFTDFTPTTWQFPYLITQLPPSTNPRYTITIPDWIPNGKYYVVVYGNVFMMQWVPETIITVVRTTPLTLIPVTTTPTTPTSPPRVTDGVYGDCAGYLCLHGTCALPLGVVSNGIDSTLPGSNYTCQCKPGFAGKYCAQTDTCEAAATAAATYQPPYTNEDGEPVTPLYCNKQYGIVTTTLASTSYSTTSATKPVCSMCQCLGTFDSADGCSTCALQCGVGTPDATCTKCTCPIDRSGSRCECTSKRFTIFYRLPPPFIQDMFKRSDNQFIPINVYEQAQLITWKKSLIFDIATDFSMPADMFEVESYGSDTTAFGVVIKLTICSPFPSVTTTLTHDESIATQGKQLDLAFAAFTTAFKALQTAGRSNGPLVGYSNEEVNHLQWYKPSFDAVNLAGRFRAAAVTPSASIAANYINPITGDILEDDEEFSADDVSNHFNQQQQQQLFSSLQTPDVTIATGIEPTIAGKFQYLHSAITASPVSDANGGFTDISDIYSSSQCTTGCILPSHPVLTPSEPTPWKAKPKPFNADILLYILLPLLFVLFFGLAILLCCTWKYQIWCFTGYKDRKNKERKAQREARRNNRSGKITTQTANATASTTTNPTTVVSNGPSAITSKTAHAIDSSKPTHINLDAGAAAGANITGDYHPEDFEDDDEAEDYFAEGTEVEIPMGPPGGPGGINRTKRQSIAIGGMKRVSIVGLPKGWSLLNFEGKQIYINTETMQSSTVKPLSDGTVPTVADDKGW